MENVLWFSDLIVSNSVAEYQAEIGR
jgi:hypothetical protein